MLKKAILATAALALSAPALADRGNGHGYGHYRHEPRVVHRHVVHRPVVGPVVYPVHRPAPRPVVVVQRPAPVVYHSHHPHTGAAILFGAVLGAAIAHHVTMGY